MSDSTEATTTLGNRMRQAQRQAREATNDAARWRDAALYVEPLLAVLLSEDDFDFDNWYAAIVEAQRLIATAVRFAARPTLEGP